MPMIHSKRPAAFKKNIETEMRAGKPQKQAVAIAYSEKREAEEERKKKMAEGGAVKGVHKQEDGPAGQSYAGDRVRESASTKSPFLKDVNREEAKHEHRVVLNEMKHAPGPTSGRSGFAHGGDVEAHEEPDGDEASMDEELSHGLGKELMGALDSRDHKQIMSCLEACVAHCMSKGEKDV